MASLCSDLVCHLWPSAPQSPRFTRQPTHVTCINPESFANAPGRIRTSDTRFRKPVLYPLSYGRKSL